MADANLARTIADLERKYDFSSLLGLKKNVKMQTDSLIKVENELNSMLNALIINLAGVLDSQSDISLWFYQGIPTTSNHPYIDWVTPSDHEGDIYYNQLSGYVYQYLNGAWTRNEDANLVQAMAVTNVELDVTIDHERKVYFTQPTPPYSSGDWWILEDGTLKICQLGKASGTYETDDFIVSSKYVLTLATKVDDTVTVLKGTVTTISETYVSVTDLATGGNTTINGDNITTGSIKSANYIQNVSGTKINLTDGTIDAKNFKVSSTGIVTARGLSLIEGDIEIAKTVDIDPDGDHTTQTMYILKSNENTLTVGGFNFYPSRDSMSGRLYPNMSVNGDTVFRYNKAGDESPIDLIVTNIRCESLVYTSQAEKKKNFEKLENGLDIINDIDIYKYNFKKEDDGTKKHIGFIIGDNFNYSEEVTSTNNDGADTYGLASVCVRAIQELDERLKRLEGGNNG